MVLLVTLGKKSQLCGNVCHNLFKFHWTDVYFECSIWHASYFPHLSQLKGHKFTSNYKRWSVWTHWYWWSWQVNISVDVLGCVISPKAKILSCVKIQTVTHVSYGQILLILLKVKNRHLYLSHGHRSHMIKNTSVNLLLNGSIFEQECVIRPNFGINGWFISYLTHRLKTAEHLNVI